MAEECAKRECVFTKEYITEDMKILRVLKVINLVPFLAIWITNEYAWDETEHQIWMDDVHVWMQSKGSQKLSNVNI